MICGVPAPLDAMFGPGVADPYQLPVGPPCPLPSRHGVHRICERRPGH